MSRAPRRASLAVILTLLLALLAPSPARAELHEGGASTPFLSLSFGLAASRIDYTNTTFGREVKFGSGVVEIGAPSSALGVEQPMLFGPAASVHFTPFPKIARWFSFFVFGAEGFGRSDPPPTNTDRGAGLDDGHNMLMSYTGAVGPEAQFGLGSAYLRAGVGFGGRELTIGNMKSSSRFIQPRLSFDVELSRYDGAGMGIALTLDTFVAVTFEGMSSVTIGVGPQLDAF
jgi:hypothetical protein